MTRLGRGLARAGWAALRIDLRGLGDSEGDFAETTLSSDVADVLAAVAALRERGLEPVVAVGHSMGGIAALLAAVEEPALRAVAVLGTSSTADHVRHLLPDLDRDGAVVFEVAGRSLRKGAGFVDDLDRHDLRGAVAGLAQPLLILHGTADRIVPLEHGEALHAAGGTGAELVRIEGGDHLLTDRGHAQEAVAALTDWLQRVVR
jgi:uncharacterized protein